MHISDRGVQLIAGFEGFSSTPYWDSYGKVWTRGFGETEQITQHSPPISRAEGLARLKSLIEQRYEWALRGLNLPLNQNQWDALCSFVWNLGAGIFTGNLRAALEAREWQRAGQIMLQYDHAGGVVLAGLQTRRQAEVKLFLQPPGVEVLDALQPLERGAVNSLVAYTRHPALHVHGIKVVRERIAYYRKAIWLAAERGQLPDGRRTAKGWGINNRSARYALLWRYSK
jgi:lysozyme